MSIELFADTGRGRLLVPDIDIEKKVDPRYTLNNAEDEARALLTEYLQKRGRKITEDDIEIKVRQEDCYFCAIDEAHGLAKKIGYIKTQSKNLPLCDSCYAKAIKIQNG